MQSGNRSPIIYSPEHLSDLLEVRERNPHAVLWAGGTGLMSRYYTYPSPEPRAIISLQQVAELQRISRTERYLELGSMVTFDRIMAVGQHNLPALVGRAIRNIGPLTLTRWATTGGNLCIPDLRLNLAAALSLLDVHVEFRGEHREGRKAGESDERGEQLVTGEKRGSGPLGLREKSRKLGRRSVGPFTRWIPFQKMYQNDGKLAVHPQGILTRIRIYFDNADFQVFQRLGDPFRFPDETIIFSAFAKHGKQSVSDYRFSITFPKIGIFRNRDVESAVTNHDLPLKPKESLYAVNLLKNSLANYSTRINDIQRGRAERAFERALTTLNAKTFK